MSALSEMPVVTVEQIVKFREAALNLEQRFSELLTKFEKADALAKLATRLNKEFAERMDECAERFTHDDGCMRRLSYRKPSWPCTCNNSEAIEAAGGRVK